MKRCKKQLPLFEELKRHIMQIENIEHYIAKKNNNFVKHQKKWDL